MSLCCCDFYGCSKWHYSDFYNDDDYFDSAWREDFYRQVQEEEDSDTTHLPSKTPRTAPKGRPHKKTPVFTTYMEEKKLGEKKVIEWVGQLYHTVDRAVYTGVSCERLRKMRGVGGLNGFHKRGGYAKLYRQYKRANIKFLLDDEFKAF